MTAIAHEAHRPTQTHAEVTRDVLSTLQTPSRGYYLALFGAVAMFLVGLGTFVMLLKERVALGRAPRSLCISVASPFRL